MTAARALQMISRFPRFGGAHDLSPLGRLLHALGDPQNAMEYIHVAGTNGKGSTATMIAAALCEAGIPTALYTSPYVDDFCERFRLSGKPISRAAFAAAARRALQAVRLLGMAGELSQFDVITAIALLLFAESDCRLAVMECGLGGRRDATNIIPPPLAAVITNIGYDHTEVLGSTPSAIAGEKCGIIKPGTGAVICAPQDYPEAEKTVAAAAAAAGVPYVAVAASDITVEDCRFGALRFSYRGESFVTRLTATYQAKNAATAIAAVRACRFPAATDPEAALHRGIARAYIPARQEAISLAPHVILDGGHNADGLRALRESIEAFAPRYEKLYCVVGMLRDKDPQTALQPFFSSPLLQSRLAGIVTITPDSPRAVPAAELLELLRALPLPQVPMEAADAPADALRRTLFAMRKDDLLLCFGSLYAMGELRRLLLPLAKEKAESEKEKGWGYR